MPRRIAKRHVSVTLARAAAFAAALAVVLPATAGGEVSQHGNLRVFATGQLSPRALPRHGASPIRVSIAGRITTPDGSPPPQLRTIKIAINRNGRFDDEGLPVCHIDQIQPSPTRVARQACGNALVGEGRFSANVVYPEQSPFPSSGHLLAFNATFKGRPAILVHIFGTSPLPISNTMVFQIRRSSGAFGLTLTANLPETTGEWGFVTGISLNLFRRFTAHGKRHSYLSAGCPAPEGFNTVAFPLARTSFSFAGGSTLNVVVPQTCRVR